MLNNKMKVLSLALMLVASPSLLLAQQASSDPTPTTPGRPHGQHDPHGKLTADQHVKVALQHLQEGRKGEAMRTLDMAVAQFPDDAVTRAVRGSLLLQDNRIAPALEDLEAAIRLNPKDTQVYVNRASAYLKFGREQEAMADLDKAIELDPNFVAAYFNRGFMKMNKKDFKAALVDFDRCIAIDPHAPGPYFNRAAAYDSLGNREAATAGMNRFKELVKDEKSKKMAEDVLKSWTDRAAKDQSAKAQSEKK